jgi:hypothetical protein
VSAFNSVESAFVADPCSEGLDSIGESFHCEVHSVDAGVIQSQPGVWRCGGEVMASCFSEQLKVKVDGGRSLWWNHSRFCPTQHCRYL